MVVQSAFHGHFYYYEYVNGKEKKLSKTFTDKKEYDAFMEKYPFPGLSSLGGGTIKRSLSKPKAVKKVLPKKKKPTTKKKR